MKLTLLKLKLESGWSKQTDTLNSFFLFSNECFILLMLKDSMCAQIEIYEFVIIKN